MCFVCTSKLFMIYRASSVQPESLLSMSPLPSSGYRRCGGTRIPGLLKSFVLLFNINSPLKSVS